MSDQSVSPLRQKMIHELQLQRLSDQTAKSYLTSVELLSKHYRRSPAKISPDEVRAFFHHLIAVRKLSSSTVNVRLSGIKFFYKYVLGQTNFDLRIRAKRTGRLPEPLSRKEVIDLISGIENSKLAL